MSERPRGARNEEGSRLGVIRVALIALVSAVAPLLSGSALLWAQGVPTGKVVYDRWCAGCHGETGDGNGPAADRMLPRPRDFRKAVFQIRTTASGELPTHDDLRAVIDEGMPGTGMPEWRTRLSEREREDVIAYIRTFSTFFGGDAPKPLDLGKAPGSSDETLKDGQAAYRKLECFKCHGDAGRGDGTSAPTLKDDWGHPIRAADLTQRWKFNGGGSVQQIYARLRTGLDGTPMPSFSDAMEAGTVTNDQLWHLAQWVHSLSPVDSPEVHEVVRASRVAAVPSGPSDSAWGSAERYWIPVVGQIIAKPRAFSPTVDGVWVQAAHDGTRLALRLTWDDPSQSPSPAWDEWLGRMRDAVTSVDGALPAAQGADRLMVEWAPGGDEGERPYFLGGSARRPVHVWRWASDSSSAREGIEKGLGRFTPRTGASALSATSLFERGQWQVQLTRALASADSAQAPTFPVGRAIPIALFVADGSSGEDDVRGAVSAWYAVHLDVPTPATVYVAPAGSALLTAFFGILLVRQARRRERGAAQTHREG